MRRVADTHGAKAFTSQGAAGFCSRRTRNCMKGHSRAQASTTVGTPAKQQADEASACPGTQSSACHSTCAATALARSLVSSTKAPLPFNPLGLGHKDKRMPAHEFMGESGVREKPSRDPRQSSQSTKRMLTFDPLRIRSDDSRDHPHAACSRVNAGASVQEKEQAGLSMPRVTRSTLSVRSKVCTSKHESPSARIPVTN